jgi:hypothetical protein
VRNGKWSLELLVAIGLLLAGGCAAGPAGETSGGEVEAPGLDTELLRLADWLTGSFSSAAQSAEDQRYFDIRIRAVRIWEQRGDGVWIYIEQAAADALDRPYRQRVYHVTRLAEDLFESRVYALDEPLQHAGCWREERPLAELGPDDLLDRQGCAVLLRRIDGDRFSGSTLGRLCTSGLRGASYASSEVEVRADGLTSWDRGFDADGVQVWGAEAGPYRFVRARPSP